MYQNSSIRIECLTADVVPKKEVYYGTIIEIWELDYVKIKVALFKCRWVALVHVKVDEYGKTYVNLDKMAYKKDPFILASQATQVFYVPNTLHKNCHVVMFEKTRILGVENVIDEEEYNQFDELPTVGERIEKEIIDNTITVPVFTRVATGQHRYNSKHDEPLD